MYSIRHAALVLASILASERPCQEAAVHPGAVCDCVSPSPPRESQADAAALILVRIDTVAPTQLPFVNGRTYQGRRVTGRVLAAWPAGRRQTRGGKDAPGASAAPAATAYAEPSVTLRTGSGGGDCGFVFEVGVEYLVYAFGTLDDLRVSICSRTRAAVDAAEDFAALGAPEIDRRPPRRAPTER